MGRPRTLTDEERREQKNAYYRAWRKANPGYHAATSQAWREANPERKTAINKAWRIANPGYNKAWVAANRERRAAIYKAWEEANPDVVRKHGAARRARLLGAFVELVDPAVVFDRDRGVCQICNSWVLADEKWHIDHRYPLSKGGEHSYANCQLAHAHCNLSKHNKIPNTKDTK